MATRYWRGGSGKWSETSHWSTTSGGSGGASVPNASHDVRFDANSFTTAGQTVTVDINDGSSWYYSVEALSIDFTGVTNSPTLYFKSQTSNPSLFYLEMHIYGDLTIPSSVAVTSDNPTHPNIYIEEDATIDVNGVELAAQLLLWGSSISLSGPLQVAGISVASGTTLNTNGNALSIGKLYASGGSTLNLSSSVITLYSTVSPLTSWQVAPTSTLNAGTSTIVLTQAFTRTFEGGGKTYYNIRHDGFSGSSNGWTVNGNNTFNQIEVVPGRHMSFQASSTQTVSAFVANGTSTNPITLRSATNGTQFTLSKASGTVSTSYLDLKDSKVQGGATWNVSNGTNSGNNTGWNFVGPVIPTANFTATPTSGVVALAVSFTDTSTGSPTSWLWDFGDSTTSTSQNPSHTYTTTGSFTVSLTATNSVGSHTKTELSYISVAANVISDVGGDASAEADGSLTITPGAVTISPTGDASEETDGSLTVGYSLLDIGGDTSEETDGSLTITQGPPPPPEEVDWSNLGTENTKEFIYKVSDHSGTFLGIWKDVSDDLQFSQPINSPGTTATVRLSRSANQTIETREPLIDQAGDPYVDQAGDPYYVVGETSNTVGEDTDVQVGYLVDVIAVYGGYEELVDHIGEPYVDQDGNAYIVATGAPMGRRVFSGKILKYKATYGETVGVEVTLASHGVGFSDEFVRSGATTTVTYSTTEIGAILKSVLDTNPGVMSYDNSSIDATGTTITQKFQLNTKLEAIKSLYNQTPDGWYWYGNVADNLVYLKQIGSTPDHVFIKGKHISKIDPEQSIENLINVVHVIGGDVGGGVQLYKEYTDAASIAQWGRKVHRITDRRITLAATAQRYADKVLSLYSQPIYTTTIEISSGTYDIETIKLGQTVGQSNFDNFIDGLVLQIVNLNYTPRKVTLQLGGLLDSQQRIVADLQEDLANEQYEQIPTAPS